MDIGLLKNMFAGNAKAIPASLKFDTNLRTKQPVKITTGNVHPTDTGKPVTTDKTQSVAQNKPAVPLSSNFRQTLGKKIKKGDQGPEALSEVVNPADSYAAQGILTRHVMLDEAVGTKALNQLQQQAQGQIPGESARLVAGSTLPISPPTPSLIAQAAKPITSEPDQILPISDTPFEKDKDTGNMQVSDEAFVAKEKPVDQKNGKELLQEVLFSDSKKLIVTDKTSASESPKTLETNETAITSKAITDQKSGRELASEMHGDESKISIAGEKPVMTDELAPPLLDTETTVSNKPVITSTFPSNQQSGKESGPEILINDNKITADSEQTVVTNKPFVPDSPKTQLSNATFAAPGDQSSHSQQNVLIGQGNPAPAAEETKPNKADTDQKSRHGKIELFELPEKNRVQVENPPVKPIAQKMNPQQTQLSDTDAEIRNNLVSNQPSSPDKNMGEQLLGNNVQPAVTEQSPASATFTKIADNANSDANFGSQIQESIHSSLRSGGQQITIQLNPPELGKVTIKFAEQGGDVTGLLRVDKPQTRDQIQQMLPEMIQNLQNSGIGIKRLEVVLTSQQDQYALKDQSSTAGQDSWSGHQSSPNPESRNDTTYNEWLTNVDNGIEFTEPQMHFADNSINMLV